MLCDENKFVCQSMIIWKLLDSTEHNDILDAKIKLREMKIQCPTKSIVAYLNTNSIKVNMMHYLLSFDANQARRNEKILGELTVMKNCQPP